MDTSGTKVPPAEARDPTPTAGSPAPQHQCWEEEPPHPLAVKNSGDSDRSGGTKGYGKPKSPLKRPAQSRPQAHTWAPAKGQGLDKCQKHTGAD